MFSLGNDVVDFSIDENKYASKRYIDRVLSIEEQFFLSITKDKNCFLWSLWSAKEAVFKAVQKQLPSLIFSPSKITMDKASMSNLLADNSGGFLITKLVYKQEIIRVHLSWPTPKVVHAIAIYGIPKPDFSKVQYKVAPLVGTISYKNQSVQVRKLAMQLMHELGIDKNARIVRPEICMGDYLKPGPPVIYLNEKQLEHEISLSHDGLWLAASLVKRISSDT